MIYLMPLPMVLVAIYLGYKNKLELTTMRLWYFMLFLLVCMVCNFLALKNLLFHAKFVPGQLKDGHYGFMGGVSFGGIFMSLMVAAFLFGLLLHFLRKSDTKPLGSENKEAAQTQLILPDWFNRLSHMISASLVGSAIALFWISHRDAEPLEVNGGLAVGTILGAAGMYAVAGLVTIVQKIIKRA